MASEPERQSEKTQERKPPPKRPAIIRIFRALKRHEDSRRHRHKKEASETDVAMARWTRRVGLFTLALVVVGVVTGGIFWRQLNVMQGQLDEMQADNRAWIAPTNYRIVRDPKTGRFLGLAFDLKNVGKEPAIETRSRAWFTYGPSPDLNASYDTWMTLPFWENVKSHDVCRHIGQNPYGDTIYPNVTSPRTQIGVDPLEAGSIEDGTAFMVFVECDAYQTEGRSAYTQYCLFLRPIGNQTIDKWPIENCPTPELNYAK